MKTHLKLFAIVALFFVGTYSSMGQDDAKKQEQYAKEKRQLADAQNSKMAKSTASVVRTDEMKPESIAKVQTENLQQLLNLNDTQTSRVNEICLAVENELIKMPADMNEGERIEKLNYLKNAKSEKFKEVLTADQFKIYQNSLKTEKQ